MIVTLAIIAGILSAIALFLVGQIVAHIVSETLIWIKGFKNHEYLRFVEIDTDVEHQKRVILRSMINPDALSIPPYVNCFIILHIMLVTIAYNIISYLICIYALMGAD